MNTVSGETHGLLVVGAGVGTRVEGLAVVGAGVGAAVDGAGLVGVAVVGVALVGAGLVGVALMGAKLVGVAVEGVALVGVGLVGVTEGATVVGDSVGTDVGDLVGADVVGVWVGADDDAAAAVGVPEQQANACVRLCVGVLRVRGGACVCEGMSERVSE